MVKIKRLIETPDLKTKKVKKAFREKALPIINIDKRYDSVELIFVKSKQGVVVHYLDEYVSLLYEEKTKEIVGIMIESFEKGFLPKYSELEKAWKLSDTFDNFNDVGDLKIVAERKEKEVASEVSKITNLIAEKRGLSLPVSVM